MFRRLVSSLPYSPALIHEVGFYAKRLSKEEITRKLSLVFIFLAIALQSLILGYPPESANASNEQDIIRGGVSSKSQLLSLYEKNVDDIKDIYSTVGISYDDLEATQESHIDNLANLHHMTRYGQFSRKQGEISFSYKRSGGGEGIRYFSPLSLSQSNNNLRSSATLVGHSKKLGWFAIIKSSATIITRGIPSTLAQDTPTTNSSITEGLTAHNVNQNAASESVKANPDDKIRFKLTAINGSNTRTEDALFSIMLSDILEYSELVDAKDATFDKNTKTLHWPIEKLAPSEERDHIFTVKMFSQLPSTAQGESNPSSYDCKLSATYGNQSVTPVDCPSVKILESLSRSTPNTPTVVIFILLSAVASITAYFYARTKQLKKEIRLIRHNLNTGAM